MISPGGCRVLYFIYDILFVEKNWPDFTEEDLDNAIIEYQKRTRKFGAN